MAPVDAPVIDRAAPPLVEALGTIRSTDYGLFADITAARVAGAGGDVVLDLEDGRVRLAAPLDPAVVRSVAAVRRDLDGRGQAWAELDGRFRGWVVVRRAAAARPAETPAARLRASATKAGRGVKPKPARRPARGARGGRSVRAKRSGAAA